MGPAASLIDPTLHPRDQLALVGHQLAYGQLKKAFGDKAAHPVWLLAGERGIGKATLTYAMAREILGTNGQNPSLIARQMAQGIYPNFLALERRPNAEGKILREINAEEGRKINAFLNQCATITGWRVIIIDAVDEMNRTAANALLKILEEPPAKTAFFLIAHSLGQTLATIRSRCCKLHLSPLTDTEISTALGGAIAPELLPLANGSIGRAIALRQAGGIKLLEQIIQAIASALKKDWRPAQALSASFGKDNPNSGVMLDLVVWALHHSMMLAHLPMPATLVDQKLTLLTKFKPMAHWVDALHRIRYFLDIAQTSHLDQNHVAMAIFFIIENPMIGDSFVYEQLS